MNRTKRLAGRLGIVLCSALLGCTTYGQSSVSVGVEIRAESDFYEPLAPEGEWVVIGSYGRCWRPGHVARDWRPYSDGYWQRTDAGWYWVSDEPWAWATYHYGRWDFNDQYGWYWVPQTQWAPAWVSWHEGGGYIGWAPLYPSGVRVIPLRAYVFVEERHFMEPVSRSTVVVNNTTIINQTVINEGPATTVIEKASGRKVQAVPVQELRHKTEAAVVTKPRTPTATSKKTVQPPVRNEAQPAEKKAVAAPAPKYNQVQSDETRKFVRPATESKPAAKPAAKGENNPSAAIKEPAGQNANKPPVKQEKSTQPSDRKDLQPATKTPAAIDKNAVDPAEKNHGDKPNE